jgi:FkbM family methyltransferase
MPAHHSIFSRYRPSWVQVPAYCQSDFLGTTRRLQFFKGIACSPVPTMIQPGPPPVDEEYFEWIDLLESVVAARGSYTMLDLGAGYGRWSVRAAFAVRQYHGTLPCHLIAVEPEPTVFEWMHLHFRDNGIDPTHHRLIHAAVTRAPGEVLFYIGGPRGGPFDRTPDAWYGQSVTKDYDLAGPCEPDGTYCGRAVLRHQSGWRSIRVPSLTLAGLLQGLGRVDLIDMDIEGQELPVVQSTIQALDEQVQRLHIGTHGKEIEDGLRQLLSDHGWSCWADYSLFSTSDTPWGTISFENGVQAWMNPRFR